jgi:hypothetical protein
MRAAQAGPTTLAKIRVAAPGTQKRLGYRVEPVSTGLK